MGWWGGREVQQPPSRSLSYAGPIESTFRGPPPDACAPLTVRVQNRALSPALPSWLHLPGSGVPLPRWPAVNRHDSWDPQVADDLRDRSDKAEG